MVFRFQTKFRLFTDLMQDAAEVIFPEDIVLSRLFHSNLGLAVPLRPLWIFSYTAQGVYQESLQIFAQRNRLLSAQISRFFFFLNLEIVCQKKRSLQNTVYTQIRTIIQSIKYLFKNKVIKNKTGQGCPAGSVHKTCNS